MRNYIKFPLVKVLVRENPLKKLKIVKIYRFCGEILQLKINFVSHGVENVSSIPQSVQNIIINHQKSNFDLNKSRKGNLKSTVDPACYKQLSVYIPPNPRPSTMKYRFRLQKGAKFRFFQVISSIKMYFHSCIEIAFTRKPSK